MPVVVDTLAYFPLPKAANTSVKQAMFKLAFGQPYGRAAGAPANIHHYAPWRTEPFQDAYLSDYAGFTRFAVVRDPIERLLSAYVHRVLMREALSPAQMARRGMDPALPAEPDLHTFVDNLDQYRLRSRNVRHHTAPLVDFLGPDPAFYGRLFPIAQLGELEQWLSGVAGREVRVPHRMASRSLHGRSELTAGQIGRLRDRYREDYRFLERAGLADL